MVYDDRAGTDRHQSLAQTVQSHPTSPSAQHASASPGNTIREAPNHWPRNRGLDSKDCGVCTQDSAPQDAGSKRETLQRSLLARTASARQAALKDYDEIAVTSRFLTRQIIKVTSGIKPTLTPNFAGHPETVYSAIGHIAQVQHPTLLVIGSLNEAKGQLEFLRSGMSHLKEDERLQIHFAGRGQRLQRKMLAVCEEKAVVDRVEFRGFLEREELYAAIREATVVVLPTMWEEPFGRVPLEAAACGRPVIAYASGGIVELVADGRTGLIVPKGDYNALWAGIHKLLSDGVMRHRLAEAAREDLSTRFGHEHCLSAFSELIRSSHEFTLNSLTDKEQGAESSKPSTVLELAKQG